MDLYNGEIVAYSIGEKQDTELVLDTLNQLSLPEGSLLHSDQGSVYTSYEYYQCCKKKNVIRSMSRKGTPADNAPIECFHSSLKCETFYHKTAYKYAKSIVIQIVKDYIKYYNESDVFNLTSSCPYFPFNKAKNTGSPRNVSLSITHDAYGGAVFFPTVTIPSAFF